MRLLCAREETWSAAISLEGFVVKANLAEIPECAIHPVGVADPYDCRSPIPTFWLADSPSAPESTWIPVMGWASNAANLYERALHEAEALGGEEYEDAHWGIEVPTFSLGERVTVWGTYGKTFTKTSTGWARQPTTGILNYHESIEHEPGSERISLRSVFTPWGQKKSPQGSGAYLPRNAQKLALSGPFQQLEDYCAGPTRGACEFGEAILAEALQNPIVLLPAQGGFAEVRLFSQTVASRVTYLVALRTASGWFVADAGWFSEWSATSSASSAVSLRRLRFEPVEPKGSTVLSVRVTKESSDGEHQSETRELLVCHGGQSPSPTCFSPLIYSEHTRVDEHESAYDLVPSFSFDGLLRLTPFWWSGEEPEQSGSYQLF